MITEFNLENENSIFIKLLEDEILINQRSINESDYVIEEFINYKNFIAQEEMIKQYQQDIENIILNDDYEDGVISKSENYILNIKEENIPMVRNALNRLYLHNIINPTLLIGIMTMIGTLSYAQASPEGPTMALGLLHHNNITVCDKAVKAFEKWKSKEGINVLRSQNYDKVWMNNYVNKVIKYLESEGMD